MRRNFFPLIILVVCVIVFVSCKRGDNVESVAVSDEMAEEISNSLPGEERFGCDVFGELLKQDDVNLIYSPMSLCVTMGMLANCTTGDTQAEIMSALGCTTKNLPDVNMLNKYLIYNLPKQDSGTEVLIANSLWYKASIIPKVKSGFRSVIEKTYNGTVTSVNDFANQESIDLINAWSNQYTNGFIPKIVNGPLSPEMSMLIADILYFKGNWTSEFDTEDTRKHTFHNASGKKSEVDMMCDTKFVSYDSTAYYAAISLPYGDEDFSMIIVLPEQGVSLEKLYTSVKVSDFVSVAEKYGVDVKIELPKFSISYNCRLKSVLQNFGVNKVFSSEADLSGAFPVDGVSVDALVQAAKIEIDENGTKAVAVTETEIMLGIADEEDVIKDFIVDRPFLFMIVSRDIKLPLFIGAVRELGD